MKAILLIICFSILSCSDSEEPLILNCMDGYPKVFGNQIVTEYKGDIYHYKSRKLTYVRSVLFNNTDERTITLINQSELSDSHNFTSTEYELIDGCIKDFRDYQRIRINENCSLITVNFIEVGVNEEIGGDGAQWLSGIFDCENTDSMVIEEAIDRHKQYGKFDSVYVSRYTAELSLIR